jgi:hypothetical protein
MVKDENPPIFSYHRRQRRDNQVEEVKQVSDKNKDRKP